MGWIDAGQIDSMRATVLDSLPNICHVLQQVFVSDGQGGQTGTWLQVNSYNCRVLADTAETEIVDAGKTTAVTLYKIYMPFDAVLDGSCRIAVNGQTYEVMGRETGRTSQVQTIVRAMLVE